MTELGVQGIFFDETPNLFDEYVAGYLDTAGRIVKSTDGILGDRLVSSVLVVALTFRLCTKLHPSAYRASFPHSLASSHPVVFPIRR